MRAYVGVTDEDWYRHLAGRPDLSEANFWRTDGSREFGALSVGEPFFFKTHYPHDRAVGGGFYGHFARLRVSAAWDFYGAVNGAETCKLMRRRMSRDRRGQGPADADPHIGCCSATSVSSQRTTCLHRRRSFVGLSPAATRCRHHPPASGEPAATRGVRQR